MSRLIWVIFSFYGSLVFAQQGQPSMPPPDSQQLPSGPVPEGTMPPPGVPFGDAPTGMSPVGLPPSPEDVMTKPAEGLSARDPFRLPEELIIKIRQKNAATISASTGGIDPTIEAIRRFPLASYQLVGIIWDVKRPKAMFMDISRSIHVVQVNDFIGNARGVITSIQSGSVTVLEGKIPQIIKLKK